VRDPSMRPWVPVSDLPSLGTAITVLVLGGSLVLVVAAVLRRALDPIAGCALALIAFLLANKVYSPQYDLWLVPFLALLPLSRRRVVQFLLADAGVFLAIWGLTYPAGFVLPSRAYVVAPFVLVRLVVLLLVARDCWRIRDVAGSPRDHAGPPGLDRRRPASRIDASGVDGRGRAVRDDGNGRARSTPRDVRPPTTEPATRDPTRRAQLR
jgi:hypothetical protein